METIDQDVGYGWRMLRKSPGFALVIVLMLALGIGANTAVFTVLSAALLRPLPFEKPEVLADPNDAVAAKRRGAGDGRNGEHGILRDPWRSSPAGAQVLAL